MSYRKSKAAFQAESRWKQQRFNDDRSAFLAMLKADYSRIRYANDETFAINPSQGSTYDLGNLARIQFSNSPAMRQWRFARRSGVKGLLGIDDETQTGWVQLEGESRRLTSKAAVESVLQNYTVDTLDDRFTAYVQLEQIA